MAIQGQLVIYYPIGPTGSSKYTSQVTVDDSSSSSTSSKFHFTYIPVPTTISSDLNLKWSYNVTFNPGEGTGSSYTYTSIHTAKLVGWSVSIDTAPYTPNVGDGTYGINYYKTVVSPTETFYSWSYNATMRYSNSSWTTFDAPPAPTAPYGKKFKYWTDGTTTIYAGQTGLTIGYNATLTAVYENKATWSVSYDLTGCTGTTPATQTAFTDESITLAAKPSDLAKSPTITTGGGSSITFNPNGGEFVSGGSSSVTKTCDKTVTYTLNNWKDDLGNGYQWGGLDTNHRTTTMTVDITENAPQYGTIDFSNYEVKKDPTYVYTAIKVKLSGPFTDQELSGTRIDTSTYNFTNWTDTSGNTYSSTYKTAELTKTVATVTANWNETITVTPFSATLPSPSRSGYTFKYWQDKNDSTKKYNPGDTVDFTENVELVAVWHQYIKVHYLLDNTKNSWREYIKNGSDYTYYKTVSGDTKVQLDCTYESDTDATESSTFIFNIQATDTASGITFTAVPFKVGRSFGGYTYNDNTYKNNHDMTCGQFEVQPGIAEITFLAFFVSNLWIKTSSSANSWKNVDAYMKG